MRLRAGIGLLLLALTGCAQQPERVTIEIDGYRVEIGKKEIANGQ